MAVSDTGPGRAAESAASVEIDPERSLAEPNPHCSEPLTRSSPMRYAASDSLARATDAIRSIEAATGRVLKPTRMTDAVEKGLEKVAER